MDKQQALQTLTAELVTAQDQLLALYELSTVMRRQTSIDDALPKLAKLTCRTMLADQCVVNLEIPGRRTIIAQYPESTINLEVFEGLLNDESGFERWLIRDIGGQEDNVLLLPLLFEESTAGFLICFRFNGEPYGSPEGKLGQALANQATAFLENMILNELRLENAAMRAELRIASEVQTSLLPKVLPQVGGIDLWGSSRPAKHVGGDFFDVLVRSDSTVYFCVGDVSGKGMPAALIMAMLLMVLRGEQRTSRNLGPAALMENLYRAAYDELTASGMFATLFLGVFDPRTRLMRYANAGHSPVIIRSKDGSATLLEAKSIPVGIFPEADVEEEEIILKANDVLVVSSDGLNEARNTDGELFSIERLLQEIDNMVGQSAEMIGRALITAVTDFSEGQPQGDDQTCLVIKGVAQ